MRPETSALLGWPTSCPGRALRSTAQATTASSGSAGNPWAHADANEFINRASTTLCGVSRDSSSDLT
eukprot:11171798-Lingulodinium_polyedra.AAC.1